MMVMAVASRLSFSILSRVHLQFASVPYIAGNDPVLRAIKVRCHLEDGKRSKNKLNPTSFESNVLCKVILPVLTTNEAFSRQNHEAAAQNGQYRWQVRPEVSPYIAKH